MKRILFIVMTGLWAVRVGAQTEVKADSIGRPSGVEGVQSVELLPEGVKEVSGGFLIDMKSLAQPSVVSPVPTAAAMPLPKDWSLLFAPSGSAVYSSGTWSGLWSGHPLQTVPPATWQTGSFRLKNGLRIHTYGEYDRNGWRIPQPAALPWERNNFKGAFELKSANGAFGIRLEVQQGGRNPFF